MSKTQLRGTQFLDGGVVRSDLNTTTPGEAVIRKAIAGTNVTITSTGADPGTGDVTFNVESLPASPAGINKEIQYNNAGTTAGASNVEIEGNNLSLISLSIDPTASATGTLIYPLNIAGKVFPKWVAPGESYNVFQSSVHFNNISTIGSAGTTTIGVTNCTVTNVGTISTPSIAATNLKTQTNRFINTSAATAGAFASTRVNALECWRGNSPTFGGFFLTIRLALETLQVGNRGFFGLVNSIAAPTNLDPLTDTSLARLGVGFNTNTGNFFLIRGPNGVAPTTVDLGANFPINTTNFYEFIFSCASNSSQISYRFRNLSTGVGELVGTLTTNLPTNTTILARTAWITNNATAAAVAWTMNKFNLEKDY